MEKKIADYLHLYWGCKVFDSFIIDEKTINNIVTLDISNYEWVKNCIEGGRHKIILRPLSDMTDTEIDELASVLLEKETTCYHKWRSEDGNCIIAEWKKEKPLPPYDKKYDYMTMGMLINESFSIKHFWDYHNDRGTGTTNEPLHNYQEITRYLLSKHFDIFQLIESRLAIDSTIKTK